MMNAVKREIPDYIEGYGPVRQYTGAFARAGQSSGRTRVPVDKHLLSGGSKLCSSLEDALDRLPLRDGMTVSFHHHLRNGDFVTNMVMEAIAARGFKDIHVAASGIFACHDPLAKLIEDEVITKVSVSTYGPGAVAKAISRGRMKKPTVMMSHGGRPRAIENGELHIDIAFIAAPSCDEMGNINGTRGKSACGCLSYAYADAQYADYVVAITDELVPYPNYPVEIAQNLVDLVVQVDAIGDPAGIASGATKVTTDPAQLEVARTTARVLDACGYVKEGMSFQTGAGGISLAVAAMLKELMLEKGIKGSFGSGGIHGYFTQMLDEGLLNALWNVQCFDLESIRHLAGNDPRHLIMSGSLYGNPENKGCVVNDLDIMILGGFEVDLDFNLNVTTGSDGIIRSSSGGNQDCAAGSKIALVVSDLMKKGGRCIIKDRVLTVTTPGETVDGIVTDKGIAINPRRTDLAEKLKAAGIPTMSIQELYDMGQELGAVKEVPDLGERIIGVVEYRDGTVIDVVRQVNS